ncbi:MAG: hypothetical protein WC777_02040 [Candidatus Gracilibacteria bacterium]|jgi:hypothetical protein
MKKYIIFALAVLVLGGLAYGFTSGALLQGRFGPSGEPGISAVELETCAVYSVMGTTLTTSANTTISHDGSSCEVTAVNTVGDSVGFGADLGELAEFNSVSFWIYWDDNDGAADTLFPEELSVFTADVWDGTEDNTTTLSRYNFTGSPRYLQEGVWYNAESVRMPMATDTLDSVVGIRFNDADTLSAEDDFYIDTIKLIGKEMPSGTSSGSSINVDFARSTPRGNSSATAGSSDVTLAVYSFTQPTITSDVEPEDFVVESLSINVSQSGILVEDLGENDNNIESIKLVYKDSLGGSRTDTASPTSGTAGFEDLDFVIPADSSATLTVKADFKTEAEGATFGSILSASLAFNNFRAVGQSTGSVFGPEKIDASLDPTLDLDFGEITYTDADNALEMDGSQTLSGDLGSEVTFILDNGSGDNTNKLPVGTLLCVDDDNSASCVAEDIFVVTAWPSGKEGTEDTVSGILVDDSGDQVNDDGDPILYALPGVGFLPAVATFTIK